jgi:hypothetical protein
LYSPFNMGFQWLGMASASMIPEEIWIENS